jgi:hypothetical protein
MSTTLRQPSFLRVMLGLTATVVMLVKMRFDAPILDPSTSRWSGSTL